MVNGYLFLMCIFFLELFLLFRLPAQISAIMARSREAFRIMSTQDMDDDSKEAVMRKASVELLKSTVILTAKLASIFAMLYGSYRVFVTVFPSLEQALIDGMLSPVIIVLLTMATLAYARVRSAILPKL